jgi:M6 family metalloprotease-like protein
VLQLHQSIQRTNNASEIGQLRSQARPVLAQRAAALEALVKSNPQEALGLAFAASLLADLSQKFPESASSLEQQGSWQGVSEHVVIDDPQRRRRTFSVRIRQGAGWLDVFSAQGEPGCTSGQTLRIDGVRVNNVAAAGSTSVQGGSVAAAGCSTLGAQNSAVLLVQFPGIPLPSNVTAASVYETFFSPNAPSVDHYWRENSYGKAWATGNVFGPVTLDRTYFCDEYTLMRTAAINAADSQVRFTDYSRIFIVFPDPGSCGWAGLGTLSCSSLSSADGAFTASTSWLLANYMGNRDTAVKLSVHEGGHNLGLHHSSTRDFGAEALGGLGVAGSLDEYGDPFSPMGTWNLGHYNAPHKSRLGWISGQNLLTTESGGSYVVNPIASPTTGLQAVKVRRGTGNNAWMWIEFRNRTGSYDGSLPTSSTAGALVHYEDSSTGARTHLLDFTPATSSFDDGALLGSWQDPYSNLSLALSGGGASPLSLNVSYGAVPCTRATPNLSISPANPSVAAGNSVSYTVSLTNLDSSGCTASTFNLASSLPSGWTTSFNPSVLTVNPGQTLNATMTKSVPAATSPATYGVDATASEPNHSPRTASANATVTAPVLPITVSLLAAPSSLSTRQNLVLRSTVLRNGAPVAGASVTFRLVRSGANTQTQNATTDSTGVASWTVRLNQRGSYQATATASSNGATATSAPVNVTVQ